MTKNKILFNGILCFILGVISLNSFAFTSIATINGHASQSWMVAYNYKSQKEADKDALEGCRVEARKNGISGMAKSCKITDRAKGPGYGAQTCGDDGCAWVSGSDDQQQANDTAYNNCSKSYKNCNSQNLTIWEDFAGFKQAAKKQSPAAEKSCRPTTNTIHCTSHCENANCLITYENGCKMRVQVTPEYDSFTNQWKYPSPAC